MMVYLDRGHRLQIMQLTSEPIFIWLSQYAYQPWVIYPAVCTLFLMCSFGFPLPEEVVIISVGILAYMAGHPEQFPPPEPGLKGIGVTDAAIVTFLGVLISDLVVFLLGRKYGPKLMKFPLIKKLITPEAMKKIEHWTSKYGMWASGVFRFLPGVRFPGFWTCGMAGLPLWKFILVDGGAALLSVPTQVLLVSYYGESILVFIKKVKVIIFFIVLFIILLVGIRKFMHFRRVRVKG
jgi:membrane protein DedA with SNARE-associated domain